MIAIIGMPGLGRLVQLDQTTGPQPTWPDGLSQTERHVRDARILKIRNIRVSDFISNDGQFSFSKTDYVINEDREKLTYRNKGTVRTSCSEYGHRLQIVSNVQTSEVGKVKEKLLRATTKKVSS